ncbi:hypothetical protein [Variovorax sp. JS1663]|uniref:hypothetical protein n=1 Tax=Variovorax sp. JS1663 TaxID=1851577 RepID=UPI000B3455A4|nr:hypothetical protein [Variovorax sp. JS1663]OUM04444.1 hypothetical protein A8M77_01695 [Variovorax sp. JS1663]
MVKRIWLDFVASLDAALDHPDQGLEQYLTFKQAVLALITDKRFVDRLAFFIDPANEDVDGPGEPIARALTEALKGAASDLDALRSRTPESPSKGQWAAQKRTALARAGMAIGCLKGILNIIRDSNGFARSGLTLLETLIEIHQTGAAKK